MPVFRTASEEETIALGERLAGALPPGATVLLITYVPWLTTAPLHWLGK